MLIQLGEVRARNWSHGLKVTQKGLPVQEVKPVPHKIYGFYKLYGKNGYMMLAVKEKTIQLQAGVLDELEVRVIGNRVIACARNPSLELMSIEVFDKDFESVFTESISGEKIESMFGKRWKTENLVRIMCKWYDLCFLGN
jgi:hypothetical protein